MKKNILIILFLIIGIGVLYFTVINKPNNINQDEIFYINNVYIEDKTNELIFDVRKNTNEKITLEYGYAFNVEMKKNNNWQVVDLGLAFILLSMSCDLDCKVGSTDLNLLINNPLLEENIQYRIVKNVNDYIFYANFHVKEGKIVLDDIFGFEKIGA